MAHEQTKVTDKAKAPSRKVPINRSAPNSTGRLVHRTTIKSTYGMWRERRLKSPNKLRRRRTTTLSRRRSRRAAEALGLFISAPLHASTQPVTPSLRRDASSGKWFWTGFELGLRDLMTRAGWNRENFAPGEPGTRDAVSDSP
jgi:hypothetical protein